MNMRSLYYVYVDYTADGRPFYVGKGNERRLQRRLRNSIHRNIVKKHGFNRQIEFETHDEQEALMTEIRLIKFYKTKHGELEHWGANLTWGGEGTSGLYQSSETREKRSKTLTGRKLTEEHKQRIREKRKLQVHPMLGKKFTKQHIQHIKVALKGHPGLVGRAPPNKGKKLSIEERLSRDNSHKFKAVTQLTFDGVVLQHFPSLKEAAQAINSYADGIRNCANGKRATFKGYVWRWS